MEVSANITSRAPEVFQQLKTLPRELVDQILNDLPLKTVLEIALYGDPALDSVIVSHPIYGRIIQSTEALHEISTFYQIYATLKLAVALGPNTNWPGGHVSGAGIRVKALLSLNTWSPLFMNIESHRLLTELKKIAEFVIGRAVVAAKSAVPVEAQAFPKVPMTILSDYLSTWSSALIQAQERHRELKSAQLNLLADFKEHFPDLLRSATDPRGNKSDTSAAHIVRRLRTDAERVKLSVVLIDRPWWRVKYAFRTEMLALIPFDWCLDLFLRKVGTFSAELKPTTAVIGEESHKRAEIEEFQETMRILAKERKKLEVSPAAAPQLSAQTDSAPKHYPPHIIEDIALALNGLYFLTRRLKLTSRGTPSSSPRPPQRRISAPKPQSSRSNTTDSSFFILPELWHGSKNGQVPVLAHSRKEFEWLGAFLRSVRYMRQLPVEGEDESDEKLPVDLMRKLVID